MESLEPQPISRSEVKAEVPISYFDNEAWKFQIETTDVIEELEHRLRGEFAVMKRVEKEDGRVVEEKVWEPKGKRLLNEEGIRLVVTVVGGHLTKVHILTDIPTEQVNRIAREIYVDLSLHLWLHYKKYECDEFPLDTTSLSLLIDFVDHYIYPNLARGGKGVFLNYLKPTLRRIESYKPMEEKKKTLSKILPF